MSESEQVSDSELWRRAVAGDGECFGVLFDRHGHQIRSYCARRTHSLDTADELVSIVFLEAWRRRAEVELVQESALPWLYGVANHTIQHSIRTARRHRRALARLPVGSDEPDHSDAVAARVDDEHQLAQLRKALHGLSARDRDVLLLCVWQQLDYDAAAVALGVPVGTVRSRLSRARARLRRASNGEPALLSVPACSPQEL